VVKNYFPGFRIAVARRIFARDGNQFPRQIHHRFTLRADRGKECGVHFLNVALSPGQSS
jgi:hypothetical protein